MKWLPWPSTSAIRKFQVKVQGFKLQGFNLQDTESSQDKFMVLAMKLKRPCNSGLFSFHRKYQKFSSQVFLTRAESIEWHQEFDAVCSFSVSQKDHSLRPRHVSFSILHGEGRELKAKSAVLGKVSLNLAELASKMETDIQTKLPISLQVAGVAMKATLSVSVSFMELRNAQDSTQLGQNPTKSDHGDRFSRRLKGLNPNANNEKMNQEVSTDDSDESALFDSDDPSTESSSSTESGSSPSSDTQSDPVRMTGLWKRRRLSFTPARTKVDPLTKNTRVVKDANETNSGSTRKTDSEKPTFQSDSQYPKCNTGSWEVKEVESRDGQAKLKASVFFASFDQCSVQAAGQSACTALVAVVAHWLHSNRYILPTRSQFDNLLTQGSSEWRKLCNSHIYQGCFPDKHFDIETVLQADLRPLSLLPDKSLVGFFSPEKFVSLEGTRSFEDIWNEINGQNENQEPKVYIVSWNDHFFVLKVEAQACFIIDSLGKRLFEGCNQAYILKFDDSAVMYGKAKKDGAINNEEGEIICRGKECCKEFIKRFLAAIPVRELEVEVKKGTVSPLTLYRRLQIDFHFTSSSPSPSSSPSIPATSSTSSLSSKEE
ncbi:hypothetical protein PVL29_004363 [Vitis rotundifolia]|uniref:C2 NT-type domain-containing protein n=1 Tax=Vitis rotundifolia TaxID=103349 RepID=A0AA39A817_VITRO|nr:hypothetical protein PVL29_004363 [Vitis rotundifolia]